MSFRENVYEIVMKIPYGKVSTYGQVASLLGNPRAARQVGFALRALGLSENSVPWWRVVNRSGYISINHGDGGAEKFVQRDLLQDEGIQVREDLTVDLQEYLWNGVDQYVV